MNGNHYPATFSPPVHFDDRGEICTTWSDIWGIDVRFVEDKISVSRRNVFRGLHGDKKTWKLVTCVKGAVKLYVVSAIRDMNNFGRVETYFLNDKNRQSILIPPGYLNGHLCLSKKCIFSYKISEYYKGPEAQVTVRYDDPSLGIKLGVVDPILSERDQKGKFLNEVAFDAS